MVDYTIVLNRSSEDKKTIYTRLNSYTPKKVIRTVYNTYTNHVEFRDEMLYYPNLEYWDYIAHNSANRYVEFRDAETYEIVGLFGLDGVLDFKDYDYDNYVYKLSKQLSKDELKSMGDIFNEILCHNVYHWEFVDVQPNDLVVDIGFNLGLFSIASLKKNPKRIIGFEPNKNLYETFKKNINNRIIEVYNCAISDIDGKISFYSNPLPGLSSILSEFNETYKLKSTEIDSISFTTMVNKCNIDTIDYLKIDCEGAEIKIFESIPDLFLIDKIKKIAMEYHYSLNDVRMLNILDRLKNFNYEIKIMDNGDKPLGMIYARKI